jgi:hypothetical protein
LTAETAMTPPYIEVADREVRQMLTVSFSEPAKGEHELREALDVVNTWYSRPDVVDQIKGLAADVNRWMMPNKQRTDKRGDEKSGDPWWPELKPTSDPDEIDLQISAMRQLVWGTGKRRLLNRMIDKSLLGDDAYQFIDDATSFASMAVYEELMGYRLWRSNQTISLRDLRDRFELAEGTSPTKLRRNGRVARMAAFGMWMVKIDAERHFAISIGPVACIFHREVFSPVRSKFEARIRGE